MSTDRQFANHINHLPIELIAQIFAWGVTAEQDDEKDDEQDDELDEPLSEDGGGRSLGLPFQVLVSHVCMLWRDVSINSPAFWCHLTFSEGPPYIKSQTWIQRSQTLPLTIEIDCDGERDPDVEDDASSTDSVSSSGIGSCQDLATVLDIIQPLVGRWLVLEVTANLYEFMHLLLSQLSECAAAPQLEVFVLHHYEELTFTDEFHPPDLGQHFLPFHGIAPKLKVVKLWGVHIDWSAPFLTDLHHFEVAYHAMNVRPSWEDFSRILRDSPNLDVLGMQMSGPATLPVDVTMDSIIELPALTHLKLSYHDPTRVSQLVKLHAMPNLRKLRLDLEDDDFSSFADELASVPSGQTKSLLSGIETFQIVGLPCGHTSIRAMYEQLRNLKELELRGEFIDSAFFDFLVQPLDGNASNAYCPNLATINTSGIPGRLMVNLIRSRRAMGCPVKHVAMTRDDDVDPWQEEWITDNVESFDYFEPSEDDDDDDDDDGEDDREDMTFAHMSPMPMATVFDQY